MADINKKQIEDQFVEKFSEAILQQDFKVSLRQLKISANTLLNTIITAADQNTRYINEYGLASEEDSIINIAQNLQSITTKDINLLRNIETNVLFFRTILNSYLEREQLMAVLDTDGQMHFLTALNEYELYQSDLFRKGRDFRGGIKKFNTFLSQINNRPNQVKRIENIANKRLLTFKESLNEATRRANKSEEAIRYQNSKRKWYYRLRDYWHITDLSPAVSNADISEIFAKTILNRRISELQNKNVEEILSIMSNQATSDYSHNNVYQISGGDFIFKLSKKRQVQVLLKLGQSFMLGSYMQYIRFAYNLQYIEDETKKEEIKAILNKKQMSSNFLTEEQVQKIANNCKEQLLKENNLT